MSLLTKWPREHLALSEAERREAVASVERAFAPTVQSLQIDIGLAELFEQLYVPLAAWLVARKQGQRKPLVLGINGAQGSGKITLFNLLEAILTDGFGLKVIGFSLDNLYKTREERIQLARDIHPLMMTRGVPGTHDVELGIELMDALIHADDNTLVKIPVFDKSIDDRCPPTVWQEWVGPVDIIIFEGWCVGGKAQPEAELAEPVNALEREEDPSGIWRRYVNEQLGGRYQELFSRIDLLLMLEVPSMEIVYKWRAEQEQNLQEKVCYIYDIERPSDQMRVMNTLEIQRFIAHYERLTRAMLAELPDRADILFKLNDNHKVYQIEVKEALSAA